MQLNYIMKKVNYIQYIFILKLLILYVYTQLCVILHAFILNYSFSDVTVILRTQKNLTAGLDDKEDSCR